MESEDMNASSLIASGTQHRGADSVPTVLGATDIREFQRLIEKNCGVLLTHTEAWNRATELVALYRMFIGPIPEDPAVAGLGGESTIG